MSFAPSELILNPDDSIYHLHLQPDEIADTIITVGDPDRVSRVSARFDRVDVKRQKREFVTHTGELAGKRITVISTGIGPDNIDIVFNELDALANIDLATRRVHSTFRQLSFIRLGTSGTLRPDIEVGRLVFSAYALGLDNLMHFYPYDGTVGHAAIAESLYAFLQDMAIQLPVTPYLTAANTELLASLATPTDQRGITLTAPGFYAPQGRRLRGGGKMSSTTLQALSAFRVNDLSITNFEMETAAIYGLASLLGHRALSCSVILANRATGDFSRHAAADTERMIDQVLQHWSELPE